MGGSNMVIMEQVMKSKGIIGGGFIFMCVMLVLFFAFSTMFSYSYYGRVCTEFLFGGKAAKYYEWFYLLMLLVASLMTVDLAISIEDIAFALMTLPTIFVILRLSPKVIAALKAWEAEHRPSAGRNPQ